MPSEPDCPFCSPAVDARIVCEEGAVAAIADAYPVTEGHCLVVPRRHVADWFGLTDDERRDADRLIERLYADICGRDPRVTGCNIGLNCGVSAGQTIFHAHFHLIPRRDGDTDNPRGGVRGVIKGRRSY